jgi:hypothetical protein
MCGPLFAQATIATVKQGAEETDKVASVEKIHRTVMRRVQQQQQQQQ